jgi:hypothetical protein
LRKLIRLLFFSQLTSIYPTSCAASKANLEVCRLLLQCNADVEAKDKPVIATALIVIIDFMKRTSVCASLILCFSSVKTLHCITVLFMAALKLPSFGRVES